MVISETQCTVLDNDMLCCTAVDDGVPTDGDQRDTVHSAGGEGH